ncbi:MAG: hypothetical protein E7626_07615 [Ruminococcaceae bacterium]|nr:hypothetical protein [Oscillospiraceae bacterium]
MYSAITLASAVVLSAALLLILAKRTDDTFFKMLKAITVVFCAVGFFRFMLCDGFIYVINGGILNGVRYESTDILSSIIRWGYFANYSVLPMAVFTKSRLFRNLACYYCLPFSVLSAVYFERFMPYFAQNTGSIFAPLPFRYVYFVLELVLAISIALLVCVRAKHFLRVTDIGEILRFIVAIPFVALVTMPVYVPQSIIGYSKIRMDSYSVAHLVWMLAMIVITIIIYRAFRFRSYEDRYNLCFFLVLALFFHYNSLYLMGFSLPRLPIQLCNLAAFFYIVAIPFKLNKFFHFCFIVNVTGALIAILSPDFATTGVGFWNLHYIFEHTLVFMIPVLAMSLRVFPRVSRPSIKYAAVGFVCYFVFCVIGGGLLNVFSNYTGQEVNYFFMFDLDKAESFVSLISLADVLPVTIGAYTFYPILMLVVFIAFSLLCLLFYRFTLYCYKIEEDHLNLRNAGLDLLEQITGKPTKLPREFKD